MNLHIELRQFKAFSLFLFKYIYIYIIVEHLQFIITNSNKYKGKRQKISMMQSIKTVQQIWKLRLICFSPNQTTKVTTAVFDANWSSGSGFHGLAMPEEEAKPVVILNNSKLQAILKKNSN